MADATYSLIILSAIVAGALVARRTQSRLNLSRAQRFQLGTGAFVGAMLGAKLPFVFSDWQGMVSGAAWFTDGKTILTGLVGGYLGVELTKWIFDIRVKTGDSFAAPVAVAVGIGRLGCYHAGCCYGTPTNLPWGVVFPAVDSLPRHPTQLYESAFHLTAALVLMVLWSRRIWPGQLIKAYILSYLGYRMVTEWIRPEASWLGGLTGYQWASMVLAVVFALLWIRDARARTVPS
ncbi:MAG: prolipoprotein diacylglyceryl transferase family protein [Pirellulales bacterium]